jgi:hypothetical protein
MAMRLSALRASRALPPPPQGRFFVLIFKLKNDKLCYYVPPDQRGEKLEPLPTTSAAGNDLCTSDYLFLCWTILLQRLGTDINNRQLSCLDTELQHRNYVKECFMAHMYVAGV